MKLSDAQIEYMLDKLEVALRLNKIHPGPSTSVITTLRSLITEPGLLEDVCPYCLGSGFKEEDYDALQTEKEYSKFLENLLKELYGDGWNKLTILDARRCEVIK